ncbi:MAG: hypothetical protein EAZ86_23715 [Oscillatoriales cyanobacterium]|nr:MAG: hypothetical protein EAZ86_23715 [Oscillatoriales cyanobacterium]
MDFGFWILDWGLGIENWALAKQGIGHWPNRALGIGQTGHCGFWILDCGFWILDCGFWILD